MTDENKKNNDWAQETIKWARTEEGQQKLATANDTSARAVNELRKLFIIDSKVLNTAFN